MATYRIGEPLTGSAASIHTYINPRPDPRINDIVTRSGAGLKQGLIQQTDDVLTPAIGAVAPDESSSANQAQYAPGAQARNLQRFPFACRFMFNPTTLSFGYAASESSFARNMLSPAQADAIDLSSGQTSLSFELLFDRTFELAFGREPGVLSSDVEKHGVMVDIMALERVVGARFPFTDAKAQVQPMRLIPVYFIFGGGRNTVGVTFVGHITSMTATYTSFTTQMVPIRAAVQVNATQMLGHVIPKELAYGTNMLSRLTAWERDAASARNRRGN